MSWLSQGIKAVGRFAPSVGSMIGGALVPGGNVIGSAVEGSANGKGAGQQILDDLKRGATNGSIIAPAVNAIAGGDRGVGGGASGGGSASGTIPSVGANANANGGSGGGFGDWLSQHWEDLAKLGITAFTTKEALQNSNRSNQLMDEGLGMARQDYASRQPYRDAAAASMLNPQTPDLSSLFANSGNPYTKNRTIPVVGTRR